MDQLARVSYGEELPSFQLDWDACMEVCLEAGQFGACQVRHHVLVPLLYPATVHLTQPEVTN